jgi:transposase
MPERFGPWSVVYQQFRDWRNQGTFDLLLKRLHIKLSLPKLRLHSILLAQKDRRQP